MNDHRYHRRRFLKTTAGAIAAGTTAFHARIGSARMSPGPRLSRLRSPILLRGDDKTAFRDPLVLYHDDLFYVWSTYVRTEEDDKVYLYRALSTSPDLHDWSEPELLRVKGPDVSRKDMGRMIDPFLVEDKDEPGKWWCFYKQRGVSYAWSRDSETWTFHRHMPCGENVRVLVIDDQYVLFHSPENGIGIKRSKDLEHWRGCGDLITLGQADWPWAETRLTAGVVVDLCDEPSIGKFVMFFHGVGPGRTRTMDNAFANCSIGIAWSDDLVQWDWPRNA